MQQGNFVIIEGEIKEKLDESIKATREALEKAGLTSHDIDRVVFVGGPTQYKPLRDLVSFELGIAASTDVNPMTAVSEGAALFAESIDWTSQDRSRKKSKGSMNTGTLDLTFNYIARTPDIKAKVMVKLGSTVSGYEFQIDNNDTGWTSGKINLENGSSVQIPLVKYGENSFKVYVFDNMGKAISLPEDKIIISRTAASIDAIPASSSIGLEVKDKVGGKLVLDYLVKEGDKLPAKGERVYKSGESLKAGSTSSIKFKLWEGEIIDPVTDNNFIGVFEIKGTDFDSGVIPTGADLITEYEMHDSGLIVINVSVPSIGNSFILKKIDFLNIYYDLRYKQFNAYKEIYDSAIKNPKSITQVIQINKMETLLQYKKQIILQGPPGTGKTREAKLIAKEILGLNSTDDLKDNEQFKLIQFHPSYTYEDFVRGIVAESKDDKIEYKNVNKTLGEFAEVALKNYTTSKETGIDNNLDS